MSKSDRIALDTRLSLYARTTQTYARYMSDCAACKAPVDLCPLCPHQEQLNRTSDRMIELHREILDEFAPEEEA